MRRALVVLSVVGIGLGGILRAGQQESTAERRQRPQAQPSAPLPDAAGYRQVVPWGPVPEKQTPVGNYVAWNPDVFWEMGGWP